MGAANVSCVRSRGRSGQIVGECNSWQFSSDRLLRPDPSSRALVQFPSAILGYRYLSEASNPLLHPPHFGTQNTPKIDHPSRRKDDGLAKNVHALETSKRLSSRDR